MDFTTAGAAAVNTPDTDTEPPSPTDPKSNFIRSFSFTNGTFKPCYSVAPPPPQPPLQVVLDAAAGGYKECLKNHAARIGGHALDGCGEFMLSPNSNPSDPTSLKCAACGCHRNFHRRENHQHRLKTVLNHHQHQHRLLLPPPPAHNHSSSPSPSPTRSQSPSPSPSPGPTLSPQSPPPVSHLPPTYFASPTQMLLALSSAVSGPSDEVNPHRQINQYPPNEKKRSRTRFTQDQKAKMCLFAEKVGWKMHKSAGNLVEEFCKEIGVGRGVFKVWMHNNKHSRKKRYQDRSPGVGGDGNGNGNGNGGARMIDSNVDEISNGEGGGRIGFDSMDAHHNTNRSSFDLVTNGGSSSSS